MAMTGTKTVKHVAAGGLHSVALHCDGTVSTWGANDDNACGRGDISENEMHLIKPMTTVTSSGRQQPVQDIIQIDAGDNHTILLDIHGKVHVSGMYKDMDSGKWRDRTIQDGSSLLSSSQIIKGSHPFSVEISGFDDKKVLMICSGNAFNAALTDDGSLYTWGMGHSGQLARSKDMGADLIDATYIDDTTGKDDNNYKNYELKKLYMGNIIPSNQRDEKGELVLDKATGQPEMTYEYDCDKVLENFLVPKKVQWFDSSNTVEPKRRVLHIACGDIHTLVVAREINTFETRVYSSGCSAFGQLGHGGTKDLHNLTPIQVLDNKYICKVAAGNAHSLALTMDGKNCYSWGKVDNGALGLYDEKKTELFKATDYIGTPTIIPFPTTLGESRIIDIVAGESTSFVITHSNEVYSWGYNENSQTGHYNDGEVVLISRPRLLDVIDSVNRDLESKKKERKAKNCRVIRVAGGGQHSLMVIKRHR